MKKFTAPWVTSNILQEIEASLNKLLIQLLQLCSVEQFYLLMNQLIIQDLEVTNIWEGQDRTVQSAVTLLQLLILCPLKEDIERMVWCCIPQVTTALVMLIREACQDQSLVSTVTVPVLQTLATLVKQGEGIIRNPHHVTLVFGALLTIPLEQLKTDKYYTVFLAYHEVLFSVLQYHPKVMLKAAPSFLNCFHRLVVSIIHEGQQKGERAKGSSSDFKFVIKCAQLVERMYTHIAAKTEEFTIFSSFMVSQYVNELQKVTVHPEVKKHLTEGIYHILDLCIDRDVKFLNTSLQMGVREVFKDLYESYNHYHKTKKQGEEKYTS
ncbi:unhealthy ribosome biogenesis protein 2 homolog [Protopterus annectens]|uniref:unhealthy ribosome biogenesis protein 2 homolog n=1 Tax=Protopterus annectens TaxID=7888 RepID=UPI001CF962CE|nr:unhealthy ribosome biogenesis protein 2 homolog [Protopterus annectens]